MALHHLWHSQAAHQSHLQQAERSQPARDHGLGVASWYDSRDIGAGISPGDLQAIVQQAAEGGIWQEASSLLDDLAALHGILTQIRDLGLTLISSTPQSAGVEK